LLRLLVPLIGVALIVRVLTDDRSPVDSRYSGSFSLSVAIAVLIIAVAAVLLGVRRRCLPAFAAATAGLCIWIAIAVRTDGASAETLREGVREISVVALAAIAYNAADLFTPAVLARLVQLAVAAPAVVALYQLATNSGAEIAHHIRAYGTLAHPNSAAMLFAVATVVSMWVFLDLGRRRIDAVATALFAAALIATFSIDGVVSLVAMAVVLGLLRRGTTAETIACAAVGLLVLSVFLISPLGSSRLAGEADTSLSAADQGETNSSFDTRLYRWKTLLPEWERSPVVGRGLGVTTTRESTASNSLNYLLPHNEYIRYLVETGVVGLACLAAGLCLLVRALLRRRALDRDGPRLGANAAPLALAIIAGCLVNSLADNTLLNSPTCYVVALVVVAGLAVPRKTLSGIRAPLTVTS
jgi:O-antigen ligase